MDFSWVAKYWPLLLSGAWQTLALLVISVSIGFVLAIGLAFAQVSGGRVTKILARAYCTFFRGTPLLIQLWLLYYGVGSFLPMIPACAKVSCGRCCARAFSSPPSASR